MHSVLSIIALVLACLAVLGGWLLSSFTLAFIAILLILVLYFSSLCEKYVSFDDPKIEELQNRLASVFPESRAIKISGSNQSFTMNKKHIYLCIKDADGHYYDDNSLMYVLLHEYAHVLCDEVDTEEYHKPKFRSIFARLIREAAAAGIYDPSQPMVSGYCGYPDH